jgi:hypothetical protein
MLGMGALLLAWESFARGELEGFLQERGFAGGRIQSATCQGLYALYASRWRVIYISM